MDHEKTRKLLKDMWTKELKRMVNVILIVPFLIVMEQCKNFSYIKSSKNKTVFHVT